MKILGLTSPISYNTAAAATVDGRLVAAVEEERYVHLKHAPRMPARNAVDYCLAAAGSDLEAVDAIAVGHESALPHLRGLLAATLRGEVPGGRGAAERELQFWCENLFGTRRLRAQFVSERSKLHFFPHHLSHAASAFYPSGFERAAILTLDGRGAHESGLLAAGEGRSIRPLRRLSLDQSWGLFYEAFTEVLGFRKHSEEGKLMGLASYGKPSLLPFVDFSGELPRLDRRGMLRYLRSVVRRHPDEDLHDGHRNLAAAVQHTLEEAALGMARWLLRETGARELCLAGGVALNCSMNGRLWRDLDLDEIFVQPASSDSGTAIGAAMLAHVARTGQRPQFVMRHAQWGPEYSPEEVLDAIQKSKLTRFRHCEDIAAVTAELLADGKVVAWFQGRSEIGPRALGGRSILADPRRAEMKDVVNARVKWREGWRPFAPSIQAERVGDYVEAPTWSPFMIVAFKARDDMARRVPAVVHVDDSCRVQTVSRRESPRYWELLEAFRERTGEAVLMNTSFNVKGQPMVNTPLEAIATFFSCGLDALALGDYLIEK